MLVVKKQKVNEETFQDIQPEKCKHGFFPPKLVRRKYNKYAVVGNTMLKCSAAILKSYKKHCKC